MLSYHKTTEEEKRAICEWKYEGEYAIYNNLPYEEQIEKKQGFGNPQNNFYSFYEGLNLIGYINLVEKTDSVSFGIGVDPRFCNKGFGQKMCKTACVLSHERYPGKPLSLVVRTWNVRAVKCYEKAGFRIVGKPIIQITPAGEGQFYHMAAE